MVNLRSENKSVFTKELLVSLIFQRTFYVVCLFIFIILYNLVLTYYLSYYSSQWFKIWNYILKLDQCYTLLYDNVLKHFSLQIGYSNTFEPLCIKCIYINSNLYNCVDHSKKSMHLYKLFKSANVASISSCRSILCLCSFS